MKTAIFDTNFWSYLALSGRQREFESLEKSLNLQILLPPSILLEVTRTVDATTRVNILRVMRAGNRKKMRTEADLESEELVYEIRRLRPNLRRIGASTKRIRELRKFWVSEIWRHCISNHEELHRQLVVSQQKDIAELGAVQKNHKESFSEWDVNKVKPSGVTAKFPSTEERLRGLVDFNREYEPWRIENLFYYKKCLSKVDFPIAHGDGTVADWCEPLIKIKDFLGHEEQYFSFWLEESKVERMPRNWLRWAVNFLQPFRKLGAGNPYDAQHSAYLVDADLFFTSDKRYFECLQTIFNEGVVRMARPVLLSAKVDLFLKEIADKAQKKF